MTERVTRFVQQWVHTPDDGPEGGYPQWRWPANDGIGPGSERRMAPYEIGTLDTLTGPDGVEFYPSGIGFGLRSLPPERLEFGRIEVVVDVTHPSLQDGRVQIHGGFVGPWFGQDGGAPRCEFRDASGTAIPLRTLVERSIVTAAIEAPPDDLTVSPPGTPAELVIALERFGLWHGSDFLVSGQPVVGVLAPELYALTETGEGWSLRYGWRGRWRTVAGGAALREQAQELLRVVAVTAARHERGPLRDGRRGPEPWNRALPDRGRGAP